jgi:hypothetical protein
MEFHTDHVRYLPVAVLITVQLKLNINKLKSGLRWIVVFFRRLGWRVKHSIFRKPQQLHEMQTVESSSDNLASLVTLE